MRSIRVVVAVVAFAFVASACEPAPPPAAQKSVVVVGDSITLEAKSQLTSVFTANNWTSSINSQGGTQVSQRRQEIIDIANGIRPNAMVISMGSNDLGAIELPYKSGQEQLNWYNWAIGNMRGALDDMGAVQCVVWLTVNDWSSFVPAVSPPGEYDLATWAPHYNNVLRQEDAARANLRVIDFAGAVRSMGLPWMVANMDDVLLHFDTAVGRQWLADFIANGVKTSCGF